MIRAFQSAIIALVLTASLAVGAAGFAAYRALNRIADAGEKVGTAADGLNTTLAKLNGPTGTLSMADEDIGAAKSLIIHADLVARHEQQQLGTYDNYGARLFTDIDTLAGKSGGTIDALSGTANAATGTLNAATDTMGEAQRTITAAQPLLGHADAMVGHADLFITNPAIGSTLHNIDAITSSGAETMANGKTASDYLTKQLITPKTFMGRVKGYTGDMFDVSAFLARHYR